MSTPIASPKNSFRTTKVHSPYATPVLNASDMTQETRDYFGCSSSDDEMEHQYGASVASRQNSNLPSPSNTFAAHPRVAPPPAPPSYIQATACRRPSFSDSTRNSTPEAEVLPSEVPRGAHHRELVGKLEFIQPPTLQQVDTPTPSFPCYRLFLGQIRFETTPVEVQWLIRFLCGVRTLKVESRGTGCFLAYFQNPDDVVEVQKLHKRVLFDHSGVWFARDQKQSEALSSYVHAKLSKIGRGFRLPKDMMVVEEEKLTRPLPIPPSPPQYAQYAFAHYTPNNYDQQAPQYEQGTVY